MTAKEYIDTLIVCGKLKVEEKYKKSFEIKVDTMIKYDIDLVTWLKMFIKMNDFDGFLIIQRLFMLSSYAKNFEEYSKHIGLFLEIMKKLEKVVYVDKLYIYFSKIVSSISNVNTDDYNKIHNYIESTRLISCYDRMKLKIGEDKVGNGIMSTIVEGDSFKLANGEKRSKDLSAVMIKGDKVELLPKVSEADEYNIITRKLGAEEYDLIFVNYRNYILIDSIIRKIESVGIKYCWSE